MTQYLDWLEGAESAPVSRLLTAEEIKAQLHEWKKPKGQTLGKTMSEDEEDTQRLSKAEMAEKIFLTSALRILSGGNMMAGYFYALPEVQKIVGDLRRDVGPLADEILSDFTVDYKDKFLTSKK